jgi:pimeloyl-ACP methyl ester carboxylesterase
VFGSLGEWDWTREARALSVRTLVVHGQEDLMVPLSSSREWADLTQGRLEVLPGAGHIPWWERADAIFPLIDSFLRESRGSAYRRTASHSRLHAAT